MGAEKKLKSISHPSEFKSRKLGNPTFTCILIVISETASWFFKACCLVFKHVWLFSRVPDSSSKREITEFARQNHLSHKSKVLVRLWEYKEADSYMDGLH